MPNAPIQRKIIHFDADCFYAAVEMRDNPALRGIPLAVGGPADRRGVIATCNYEARAFGVRSAMPTRRALQLCPQLVIVLPDFARYKSASQAIFNIYREYSDLIEPLSLDEAYVDVSACSAHRGSATLIAREIRARVREETGLVVSAGLRQINFSPKSPAIGTNPMGCTSFVRKMWMLLSRNCLSKNYLALAHARQKNYIACTYSPVRMCAHASCLFCVNNLANSGLRCINRRAA